jgi:phosphoribosylglycinamide formyltransferase-1
MQKRIAIFISGRGSNMEAILRQIRDGALGEVALPVLVFSNQPEAKGLHTAIDFGVSVACIPNKGLKREQYDQKVLQLLGIYDIDYIVLAGYMRILSPVLVRAYPRRIINIHPADTRQHQGLHGYEWAWQQQLPQTYVTVHYVDEGLDTGNIIAQAEVDLRGCASLEEVERRGLAVEHQLYSQTLLSLLA